MLASTSADNLEVIESVLASTMAEFLQLSGQPSVDTEAAASREQGSREQQVAVYERTAAAEPLQLHDTGALEDALERAEKKRVETAAKGQTGEDDQVRSERVQARVAELLAKQSAKGESDKAAENMQITQVTTKRPPPKSVEAEATFLQIARHMDPAVGKETLERAALQVKISDTRVVRAPAAPKLAVVAAKFVVTETEGRLRSAASAGIKTIVAAMSQHQYNPDVQQAGCKGLTDLAAKLKGQKEDEAGTAGMRAAIQALRCLPTNAQVQEAACLALQHLAPLIDVTTVLTEGSEAVTAVISEYTSNAAVLTHACRALIAMLGDLNGDSHARAHAIQANAVGAVTQALKAQPRFGPLHESATELLVALIEGDAERDACWALGGAQLAAVSIANHPSLPAVVQNACGLLERLCNTPQRAEAACALDAIAIVLTAVRMHRAEASVQIAGATCLKAMIVTANGKAKAAQAGAMEAAAVAVFGHADNVKMQEVGARLIKSLAVLESVRSRPTAAAAIEGLCASVSKHRENRLIAAEACGALCNLCIDQPLNRRKLAESGAAECVVAVMEEHIFQTDVQEAGCAVLWVIGAEPGSEVLTHNAPAAIVNAMRRYPQQASLQTVACAAFRAIAEQPGAEEALVGCGALEAVLDALRSHGTNPAVQQNGMEAVAAIGKLSAAMKRLALDEGTVDLCRSAMTLRFGSDEDVRVACEKVLDILEGAVWITSPTTPTKQQQQPQQGGGGAAPAAAAGGDVPAITAE